MNLKRLRGLKMTKLSYKTLLQISLKISEILSLYITVDDQIKFPREFIEPCKDMSQMVYITLENDTNRLLSIIPCYDLFEDLRDLCRDWNILNKPSIKETK
jgi:hypothetical protein